MMDLSIQLGWIQLNSIKNGKTESKTISCFDTIESKRFEHIMSCSLLE